MCNNSTWNEYWWIILIFAIVMFWFCNGNGIGCNSNCGCNCTPAPTTRDDCCGCCR